MGTESERNRWRFGLAECLLGANFAVMLTFALATIPWAMRVEKTLAEIKVREEAYAALAAEVSEIRREQNNRASLVYRIAHDEEIIADLKRRVEKLESK